MSFIRKILEAGAVVPFIRVPFKASASSETRLRRDLADFGRMLHAQGFVAATDGNLSVRLDEERVMVTPSGYSKGSLEPEQMVIVDLEGQKLSGSCCPTSEIGVHLTIYRMRPDVGAVVHAHPCTATGFASAGIALDEPLCSEIVITLGSVPLAPYSTPGSSELSENLKPFIPDHDAILMANHGVVTCAEDLQHAYMKMEAVEHYAKIVLVARQLGGTKPLDHRELAKLMELRTRYLKNGH